jgi:hypothetical protein
VLGGERWVGASGGGFRGAQCLHFKVKQSSQTALSRKWYNGPEDIKAQLACLLTYSTKQNPS